MSQMESLPLIRNYWIRLILGADHPLTISSILICLGVGICWFSLVQISSFTQTPTRYELEIDIETVDCPEGHLMLRGEIASDVVTALSLTSQDRLQPIVPDDQCKIKSVTVLSNLRLQPIFVGDDSRILYLSGLEVDHPDWQSIRESSLRYSESEDSYSLTIEDDVFVALRSPSTLPQNEPTFEFHPPADQEAKELFRRDAVNQYVIRFPDEWQPLWLNYSFDLPENVRTYFDFYSFERRRSTDLQQVGTEQDGLRSTEDQHVETVPLEIVLSFYADEVALIRGFSGDTGEAQSVDGFLRFGIENSDAESKRESGNVRYSAVLGIGIALVIEAFVILLAVGLRGLTTMIRTRFNQSSNSERLT